MNQLILKFAHAAGIKSTWEQAVSPAEQRFADLIIEKCCDMMIELEIQYPANLTVCEIKKTFGVEP